MAISIPNLILILLIVLILFGAGKLPKVMGDIGKGIKNFRTGIKGGEDSSEKSDMLEDNTSKE
jgi:sec-independent protein translocase protein TatA